MPVRSDKDILQTQPSAQLIDDITVMFVDWKFFFRNRMKTDGEYVEDWGQHVINMWASYLTAERITEDEFFTAKRISLKNGSAGEFPPDNPQEFLDLVRPRPSQTATYPDVRIAYLSATSPDYNAYDHPIVVHETVRRCGEYALKNSPEYQTYPMWQQAYKRVCEEHAQGKVFRYPPQVDIAKVSVSPFQGLLEDWRKKQQQA